MVDNLKPMQVLVVGGGSIGRRHIANLALMDEISDIAVVTRNRQCLDSLDTRGKARLIGSLAEADPALAVIANDTNRHVETALSLAERGIHLMIEKPLSHSLIGTDLLRETVAKRKIKVLIAYNLRFLGAVQRMKEILDDGGIGRPCYARFEVGQYLPAWRPDTDYRTSYSAHRSRGGGVALDLSHEIDLMRYLFGDPPSSRVIKARTGDLDIDSDDLFEGIYLFNKNFVCTVHLDYLQRTRTRTIKIVGTRGELVCDIAGGTLTVLADDEERTENDPELFDVPGTYRDEIRQAVGMAAGGDEASITLDDGIAVLKLLEEYHV